MFSWNIVVDRNIHAIVGVQLGKEVMLLVVSDEKEKALVSASARHRARHNS